MRKYLLLSLLTLLILPIIFCVACFDSSGNDYYISFSVENNIIRDYHVKIGEHLQQPPISEKSGYIFKGWYKSQDYIEKWDFENDIVTCNQTLYGYYVLPNEETFNVLFYDNQTLLHYQKIPKGGSVTNYQSTIVKQGCEFEYWQHGNNEFKFDIEVTSDIILKIKWRFIPYKVTFIIDNKTVSVIEYNALNMYVTNPPIPEKEHYVGKWENYILDFKDCEVKAIYTPLIYTASFSVDNVIIKRVKYSIEDQLILPEVPTRKGYNGEWTGLPTKCGDVTIVAKYTPITYTITYKGINNYVEVYEYTVENLINHTPPAVPEKQGHSAVWEKKNFDIGNIVINAIYTPLTYTATFTANGNIIGSCTFSYDNMNIYDRAPKIPQKVGYIAQWDNVKLKYEDCTIAVVYTPIVYNADFFTNEEKIATTTFTVESTNITVPVAPNKEHYSFAWGEIPPITASDIKVIGTYTPITYYATFVADDIIVSKQPYTVEDTDITIPKCPQKDKYDAAWDEFILTGGDTTINAIYTPHPQDELEFKDEFTYKTNDDGTLTITGYVGTETFLYIPSTHEGHAIKSIAKQAFKNTEITGIKFNYGIEVIEVESFFECKKLTSVILPESLKSIGMQAFYSCPINTIKLPNSLSFIDEQAFAKTALTQITLPNSLSELKNVFTYCEQLSEVVLGKNINKFGDRIFEGCKKLTEITIPTTAKAIRSTIFSKSSIERIILVEPENWKIYTMDNREVYVENLSQLSDPSSAFHLIVFVHTSRQLVYEPTNTTQ